MSDAKLNSLRAITHQLDAWLAFHGDTAKPLRALLLLREEIAATGPVGTASEAKPATAPEAPTAAPKPDEAADPSPLDVLNSLLQGFLPHSVATSITAEVAEGAKALNATLGTAAHHLMEHKYKPE